MKNDKLSFSLQIVPSYRSAPPPCDIFVRAQFEYDPLDDDLIPCAQVKLITDNGKVLKGMICGIDSITKGRCKIFIL